MTKADMYIKKIKLEIRKIMRKKDILIISNSDLLKLINKESNKRNIIFNVRVLGRIMAMIKDNSYTYFKKPTKDGTIYLIIKKCKIGEYRWNGMNTTKKKE